MSTYPDLHLYIDGQFRKTIATLPVVNPANEEVIGDLPIADQNDLDDALEAAGRGFKVWSRTSPRDRSDIILKAARLMRERINDVAYSITCEHGKPYRQGQLEVVRGSEFFEWDAGECQRLYGRAIPGAPGLRHTVLRQPIGTVAAFAPWNFPMSQPARKVAGALAAGCSVILKAAEETPAGALHIARAFHDAGLPAGVLNLVFGAPSEISSYLIPQDQIRLVAFTGSTVVGRQLTGLASDHMTPVLMELGGHAPVIVCDDVDPEEVGGICASRKYRNAGQVCTSPTRFYVGETQFETFAQSFVASADAIVVGDGLNEKTQMGPVANERRLAAMSELVEDAVSNGAELRTGGHRIGNKGYFFEPTVLANVPDEARIMSEEPFGPIAIINPVSSLEEGIAQANRLPFGLAAYGFTHSAANVEKLVDGVETGNLSINTLEASLPETPFGGVKSSGYGREGGEEGLHHYTVVKNVSHKITIG
ncbi:NAD-dependent succinate-semialdehyde dehydrogenase [Labrenzia sp. DG1229]|uniref:NAD-dependent succinate-semialdehyde dehydrogenase n=1 Tax=Labrenzia sp. DG1229 TaxID=681847 RepID=UPI0004917DED|nr:NAD-dependent succinate-semialdehyde dehydrogenase [Labrenzia sp. DG1229]